MVEGSNAHDLQRKCDHLTDMLAQEVAAGRISQAFVPSMIFPGEERARRNFTAWRSFWNEERIAMFRKGMADASQPVGFSPGAFDQFFTLLHKENMEGTAHTGAALRSSRHVGQQGAIFLDTGCNTDTGTVICRGGFLQALQSNRAGEGI